MSASQDVENVGEESISGEREVDELSEDLREKDNGEESDSEGNQDNGDVGSHPGEMKKSKESSNLAAARTNEIPDDEPLVNNLPLTLHFLLIRKIN